MPFERLLSARTARFALHASGLLALAMCMRGASAQQTQPVPAAPQTGPALPLARPSYLLHAGDDLEITFLYNPELNQRAPIRPDGRLSMPLLGEIHAEGMTIEHLTEVLQNAYRSEVRKVSISVQLRALPNQVYFVGGEVARPGILPLRGAATSALDGIIEAGGLKESASRGTISVLRRSPSGSVEIHSIALKAKKGIVPESATFQLQPLDAVIISESKISKADRAVDQYLRRLSPVLLTGGFSYLFGRPLPY